MNEKYEDIKVNSIGRRIILGFAAAAAALPIAVQMNVAHGAVEIPAALRGIKAMTFDIQGTLFDYYTPFIGISADVGSRTAIHQNWPGFLAEWNAGAGSIIQEVITKKRSWIPPGQVFRKSLDNLITARGLAAKFDEADRVELMTVWSRMVPWHDSVTGIKSLQQKVTVATLSNAGMAAVIGLVKHAGLAFDAVLSGELVHSYKPSPDVYRSASTYLGFPPSEIMMVAAHKFDLKAAKANGFRTAYIPRPFEIGPATKVDHSPEPYIDIIARDLVALSANIEPA
ncbi:haloacid dehalogenase type II [Acidisoma cellulosilytica]|uniref:(S)-2-haloacid dehalogenase n=1 Tax=Acidisoma cellulosilyticum TaxID=2802395 RepID=A0A963Z4B9_9PROT|nr:haloacid dehalogenase type II [Acidisoma cellulosilyticum]MCB8882640.1 haloacid dehalogenase type II [Acidisoma cellulosilyticum]